MVLTQALTTLEMSVNGYESTDLLIGGAGERDTVSVNAV